MKMAEKKWAMGKRRQSQPVSLTTQHFLILKAADQHLMLRLSQAVYQLPSWHQKEHSCQPSCPTLALFPVSQSGSHLISVPKLFSLHHCPGKHIFLAEFPSIPSPGPAEFMFLLLSPYLLSPYLSWNLLGTTHDTLMVPHLYCRPSASPIRLSYFSYRFPVSRLLLHPAFSMEHS